MNMKKTKIAILSIITVLTLIFSCVALTGCYIVDSGKMRTIEGTYELTNYSTNKDEKADRGIRLFIVIRSDGNGYYAYEDNDTPLHLAEMKCRFTQDPDKSGYYDYVELEFLNKNDWKKFGINARGKSLNSSIPKYKGNLFQGTLEVDYYVDVDFRKVDRATDLSYITETLGELSPLPYGAMAIGGTYASSSLSASNSIFEPNYHDSPLVYFYIRLDILAAKGEAWYMKKSDEVARNETFDISITKTDTGYTAKLGNTDATLITNGSYSHYIYIPTEIEIDGVNTPVFYYFNFTGTKSDEDIQADIDSAVSSYNLFKENQTENDNENVN